MWLIFFLFFVVSLAPIYWHKNVLDTYTNISSSGDYTSFVNIGRSIISDIFAYNENINGGLSTPWFAPQIIPFKITYFFLSQFHLSPLIVTLLIISQLIFLSIVSMYFYMMHVLKSESINEYVKNIFSGFAGVIYAFSPYTISLIFPGHFLLLYVSAFFPISILLVENILESRHRLLYLYSCLFIIFFIQCSGFTNIGILVLVSGVISIYSMLFSYLSLKKSNFKEIFLKILFINIVLFLANIWWIVSFIMSLANFADMNQNSINTYGSLIGYATQTSTILQIIKGTYDRTFLLTENFVQNYNGFFITIFYSSLTFFSLIGLFFDKHKNRLLTYIILIICIIYFLKGINPPFQSWMLYGLDHIPGFQILRRPAGKLSWILTFFIVISAITGIVKLYNTKYFRKYFIVFLVTVIFCSSVLILLFIRTPLLKGFNIPNVYYTLDKYLEGENASRVLLIPDIYDASPKYNKDLNYIYGNDFFQQIITTPIISPDTLGVLIPTSTDILTNELYKKILDGKDVCNEIKELNVSHIIVRNDIINRSKFNINFVTLTKILHSKKYINNIKVLSSGKNIYFNVFLISPTCRGKMITSDVGAIEYSHPNPTKYTVKIKNISNTVNVRLTDNFSSNWRVFIREYNTDQQVILNDISYNNLNMNINDILYIVNGKGIAPQNTYQKHFNEWKISSSDIKKSGNYITNKNGTVSIMIDIIYMPQLLFYCFSIITMIIFFGALLFVIKSIIF